MLYADHQLVKSDWRRLWHGVRDRTISVPELRASFGRLGGDPEECRRELWLLARTGEGNVAPGTVTFCFWLWV